MGKEQDCEEEIKKTNKKESEEIPSWAKSLQQTMENLTETLKQKPETPEEKEPVVKVPVPPTPPEEEPEDEPEVQTPEQPKASFLEKLTNYLF